MTSLNLADNITTSHWRWWSGKVITDTCCSYVKASVTWRLPALHGGRVYIVPCIGQSKLEIKNERCPPTDICNDYFLLPSFWNKDGVKWYAANIDMDQCGISAKDYSGISLYSRYKLITPFRINVICLLDFLFNIYIMILTVYRLYLVLTLHNQIYHELVCRKLKCIKI